MRKCHGGGRYRSKRKPRHINMHLTFSWSVGAFSLRKRNERVATTLRNWSAAKQPHLGKQTQKNNLEREYSLHKLGKERKGERKKREGTDVTDFTVKRISVVGWVEVWEEIFEEYYPGILKRWHTPSYKRYNQEPTHTFKKLSDCRIPTHKPT